MTDIDNPVVRRTKHTVHGRAIIATLTPGGITLRLERTKRSMKIDYLIMWAYLDAAERRGAQSDISIKPRKG